tara:strand:+ start:1193 stop:1729 length:537 start_codon:yes stop_codon:yes gene_type:complete
MQYSTEKNWYVIRVRSQAERLVQLGLYNKRFEVLNPTYQTLSKRKDRRKVLNIPIFKGYMFIRSILNHECHLEILKTPGVVEILKSQNGPTPVPNEQIRNVLLLEGYVGDCFFGNNLETGDPVLVREGPLSGLRGIIERIDRKNLHIHVDAIPGSVMIKIDPNQVQLEKNKIFNMVTS